MTMSLNPLIRSVNPKKLHKNAYVDDARECLESHDTCNYDEIKNCQNISLFDFDCNINPEVND